MAKLSTHTSLYRQAGLTLIEFMIAIAIGLLLLAGLTTLIVQQSRSRDELDKSSRQIENGRYAMQLLHDDIQHAGFYGQYSSMAAPVPPLAEPNPCATDAASLSAAMVLPLQGYDAPATVPAPLSTCLSNANHLAGTDILVVRRADSGLATLAAAAAGAGGQMYLQATPGAMVMNTGANAASFTLAYSTTTNTGPADLRAWQVHIYFISPCSTMANGSTCAATDDSGSPIPTLKRLELSATGGTTTWTLTPLVEAVQNLQFDYGVDSDADGYPDSYVVDPTAPHASPVDWSNFANVMAVRVNLLARNNDSTTGYSDAKTYSLGIAGTVGPFSDAYKRHAYSELVRAINPSGRRALQ